MGRRHVRGVRGTAEKLTFTVTFALVLALALLFALLAIVGGCRSRGGAALVSRDFGDPSPEPYDAPGLFSVARDTLQGRASTDRDGDSSAFPRAAGPGVGGAPGRRVFVALWRSGRISLETARAPTLDAAVRAAAEALVSRDPEAASGRVEIDVPTSVEEVDLDDRYQPPTASIGLEGLFIASDDGKSGAILPGEVAQRGLVRSGRLDRPAIASLLGARAGVSAPDVASLRAYRFRTDARVESAGRDGALPITRGIVAAPATFGPEELLAAVRRGADYLARVLDPSGRYLYLYHPREDRDDPSYGWLRHAGTTYALLEAFEELGDPRYLEKAELALRFLWAHLSYDRASQGRYVLDTDDEEQQKVGGAGLSLLALAKHAAVTGKRENLETMRALARFIIKQQYPDGHFRSNGDIEREVGKKLKREAIYYPGEAVLALVRLYGVDPQPAYLDAARKGADFIVNVRDAYASEDHQEHDHWISYAYNDLYRLTRDDAYAKHAFKIARAILKKQRRAGDAPAPDLVGTFYDGQVTPASTRLEAYDADIVLSRFAGEPERWLLDPAREVARSILGQQFGRDNAYWLANPAKADGGVRESLVVDDVRIDYVQHAMSAWLHLARILRDPAYGKTGIPSQDPVRDVLP